MVEKLITPGRNVVIDFARYQAERNAAGKALAMSARTCRHCGAALSEGEREVRMLQRFQHRDSGPARQAAEVLRGLNGAASNTSLILRRRALVRVSKDRLQRSFSNPSFETPCCAWLLSMRTELNVLATVDVDLGAVHVGTGFRAQHIDDLGDLVRRAQPVQRDLLATIFSVPGDRIEVSISPGAIALTRTPTRPKSDAISRVREAQRRLRGRVSRARKGCTREPAIEVTFTTEPLAAFNSSSRPRAIMIGAKKFTRNMWLQVSMSVSIEPSRPPSAAFGEIAALLTSACSAPPSSRWRISEIARVVSAWSARSTWM